MLGWHEFWVASRVSSAVDQALTRANISLEHASRSRPCAILFGAKSVFAPRMPATRSGASLLCPNCSPSGALLAAGCCTALLLKSLGRSTRSTSLRHPSRLHSQHGCWGSPRAACGGSPRPGAGLAHARTPTYDLARNPPAQRCDASSRAGPQACCPRVSRAGKVRAHATRWCELSGGAARGYRQL